MSARWLDAVPRRPPIGEAFTREREALADGQIRLNLWRFAAHWRDLRAGVLREVDFESLRERMASAKEAVLADFERHRGAFREAASRAGWVLHEAATAPEACEVVARLARERGVRLAVKTKSMVTEEIDLNAHLSQEGVPCVETDLGEWIIQLAGEHPSHMVIPAIHKNRRQVGDLFERVLGRPVPREDIPEQVAQARRELRELFLAAGMGISGANALIAPTGTVVMVTNEGNGRLTTSLPPLHVVVSGYDKLLPDWDAAAVLLRLLARSASGQRITTYTTFLTGPRRAGQERHIVLVDNGRTAMRQDPLFRDALRCIRCAACANVCPSYQVVGGHAFGHVYTGPIGLVTTPFHHGLEHAAGPQSLCVGCGACDTVCPSKIPISRLIGAVRTRAAEAGGLPLRKRLALGILARPRLFGAGATLAGWLGLGPGGSDWRRWPRFTRRPMRRCWKALAAEGVGRRVRSALEGKRVAVFSGCLTDRVHPETGEAIVRVLRCLGAEPVPVAGESCCGLPALNSGDRANGRTLAEATVRALDGVAADWIVSGSTSCVAAVRQEYGDLLRGTPLEDAARRVAGRLTDFCSLVADVARPDPLGAPAGEARAVAIHDACQTANALGLREPVRRVLEWLGLRVVELGDAEACCGFGGAFSFDHPGVAREIAARKVEAIRATGCDEVVSDNPGCLLHLQGVFAAQGLPLRAIHAAEVAARRLADP